MWSFFSRGGNDFPYVVGEEVQGTEQSIWSLHKGKHKERKRTIEDDMHPGSDHPQCQHIKSTEEEVSIFVFDVKGSSESQMQLAKASFKKMKTLRHPNIMPFLDGYESDKVMYVVTECVTPLEMWLNTNQDNSVQVHLAISWGLHQVARGLTFLVNDCNLIHNNVCIASVLVDKSGEWKLGGLDYMYPATGPDCIPPVKILPALEKYDPPEKTVVGRRPGHKWSSDMWGLGCLIWEVFNGCLPRTSALKTINKIPKSLVPQYCELVGANPKSRPNPGQFIKDACAKGGFIDNKFVQTMLFVEEIQSDKVMYVVTECVTPLEMWLNRFNKIAIPNNKFQMIKDDSEKLQFFNRLPTELDSFPQESCRYKILPQLLHAFEFGNAGSAILAPLFKLGKLLSADEYQKKIIPCIVKLFSSTDRATRVKLLQQMENFVEHLTPDVVNGQIFPSVIQGFMDTNPIVREHTIKSMLHLAPKLNYKNLNEELLKYFARLQVKDDQGGIRTNTTVCLGKIACYLHPQMRQKVMSSALLRAVKDPFPPARQAGILAMAATQNFFTLQESATRLLPTLCALTLDPEKTVRDQAFRAISCFLAKLQKVSEDPSLAAQMEKDVTSGGTSASGSAAGWAGWAVSGMSSLTSKIYRGKGAPDQQTNTDKPHTSGSPNAPSAPSSEKAATPTGRERTPPVETNHPPAAQESGWDDDNWEGDKDWGDMDEAADTDEAGAASEEKENAGDGWEDEDWGSLEETMDKCPQDGNEGMRVKKEYSPWGASDFAPADKGAQSASAYNWGDETSQTTRGDFFSDMLTNPKKKTPSEPQSAPTSTPAPKQPAPHPTSQSAMPRQTANHAPSRPTPSSHAGHRMGVAPTSPAGGWDDSGWGDDAGWGGDTWSSMDDTATGASKEEMARQMREQKKAQRQKEMEQKRAARQAHGAMKLGAKKLTQF